MLKGYLLIKIMKIRVEEAYNYRKELKCMEINEKERIEKLIDEK